MTGILLFFFLQLDVSQAARPARVVTGGAKLLEAPQVDSYVIKKLRRGMNLAVSNVPTNGYHKARTPDGEIGWVSVNDLRLPEWDPDTGKSYEDSSRGKGGKSFWLAPLGGMTLFPAAELTELTGYTVLANGFHFGAEIAFVFGEEDNWFIGIRGETLGNIASVQDRNRGATYQIEQSSKPGMLGVAHALNVSSDFITRLSLWGGMGFEQQIRIQSVNAAAPNEFILQGQAIAALAKLDLNYRLTRDFCLFVEVGYRFLSTIDGVAPDDTISTVSGTELYRVNGVFFPVPINLSGPMFSGGIALYL